ncbi:hypothetical protein [Variovorax sp. J31P207]|uniref:hypothetical protein n=1 Tax=Variovorax sp. J31P207 TaxID=3053510 RepID=UPI0025756CA4|nr:hypothetical protein [Variovorax sp. J31P207]MDM0071437.1 hypothetical protein [Variovorax sp. J31P207]
MQVSVYRTRFRRGINRSGDGGFRRWLAAVARTDVLPRDDWGTGSPGRPDPRRPDASDRRPRGNAPTIVSSQFPVKHARAWISEATIADAFLGPDSSIQLRTLCFDAARDGFRRVAEK